MPKKNYKKPLLENLNFDKKWTIGVISPLDKEKLVAEISYEDERWALITQEHGPLEVEFFSRENEKSWKFDYEEACRVLANAKNELQRIMGGDSKFFPK